MVKKSACKAGDLGLISGSGRSPEGGNGNPLQYSCLGNPMDRETWQVTVLQSHFSRVQLCVYSGLVTQLCPALATAWTVAHQAPLSMGFSRQEYWSGLPFPPSGDLPNTGIKPTSLSHLHWQVDFLPLCHLIINVSSIYF